MVMTDKPMLVYGVWISGRGWLKDDQHQVFGDPRREYAECAAHVYGQGASVRYIDDSMIALERMFLEREQMRISYRLTRWINGILAGHKESGHPAQ
jgi:hypothetical protein